MKLYACVTDEDNWPEMCVKLAAVRYSDIQADIQKSTTPSISLKFGTVMPNHVLINILKAFYDASISLASRAKIRCREKKLRPLRFRSNLAQ